MNKVLKLIEQARPNFKPIKKDKEADLGKFKYQYADLEQILDSVTEPLKAVGVYISHEFRILEAGQFFRTTFSDIEGDEVFFSEVYLPDAKDTTAQQLGGWITYLRRYMISAMLGLVAEEDIDANGTSKGNQRPQNSYKARPSAASNARPAAQASKPQQNTPKGDSKSYHKSEWKQHAQVTEPQLKRLFAICKQNGFDDDQVKYLAHSLGITGSRKEMNMEQYELLVQEIQNHGNAYDEAHS